MEQTHVVSLKQYNECSGDTRWSYLFSFGSLPSFIDWFAFDDVFLPGVVKQVCCFHVQPDHFRTVFGKHCALFDDVAQQQRTHPSRSQTCPGFSPCCAHIAIRCFYII